MPEIAEVRTVVKHLDKHIVGKKIIGIDIFYPKMIDNIDEFKREVIGKTFKCFSNYGKWIIISLGDKSILGHLRMEGKFFIKNKDDEINKHEHVIFYLDDGTTLRYHDTRKFGRMKLVDTNEIYKLNEISKLGIEPDSKMLTANYIYEMIHKKNIPIKTLLLDQTIINGLGNIYADEVLFASNILPNRLGSSITMEECEKIKDSCYKIITKATSCGGSTIRSYTSSLGVYGTYQNYLMVHTKKSCSVCGSNIIKTRVGGRGTYYCPKCQK